MLDASLILAAIVVIVFAYIIIKFIVSPILRIITGLLVLFFLVYILTKLFGFDLNKYLGPLAPFIDANKLLAFADPVLDPVLRWIKQAFNL